MNFFLVKRVKSVKGKAVLLGDKSIACRSIIISAISRGKTTVKNFPPNKDCLYAIKVFRKLGIKITQNKKNKEISIFGKGLYGLKRPKSAIFVGESGTTLRLALGVLAGQNFAVTLKAGKSLSQRPMLRVTRPLRMMGAIINARSQTENASSEEYPPIMIKGRNLKAITYKMPIASAQVKSAVLLAGLYAKGKTCVVEPIKTRDHTERMLKLFKADIKVKQNKIITKGKRELTSPKKIFIPGDISSASFFMVLGTILPNSHILLENVNLNPSRTGIIKVLKRMGADIQVTRPALLSGCHESGVTSYEPMGDIIVKSSSLQGTTVKRRDVPSLIDELPILMVAACFAKGKSIFEGVNELRVKETDRIKSMSESLGKMGANIKVIKTHGSEQIMIEGARALKAATIKSFGDHRTAMSMVIAGLASEGTTRIDNIACINKSFPNFLSILKTLIQ